MEFDENHILVQAQKEFMEHVRNLGENYVPSNEEQLDGWSNSCEDIDIDTPNEDLEAEIMDALLDPEIDGLQIHMYHSNIEFFGIEVSEGIDPMESLCLPVFTIDLRHEKTQLIARASSASLDEKALREDIWIACANTCEQIQNRIHEEYRKALQALASDFIQFGCKILDSIDTSYWPPED